jgi:hypothetical protein
MENEDDVAILIDPNEVNRSINRFTIDEVVVHINQNKVSRSIKKFTRSNFQVWKFQMTIIFQSKELLDIVEGTKMIENVDDQRIWRKHNNHAIMLIINAIGEKSMASLLNYRTSTTMNKAHKKTNTILQQHFFNLAMKPNQDISCFIYE